MLTVSKQVTKEKAWDLNEKLFFLFMYRGVKIAFFKSRFHQKMWSFIKTARGYSHRVKTTKKTSSKTTV